VALTQRFGLTYFGGEVEGSLFDDGQKYTSLDRRTIDRLLSAMEVHDHAGGTQLPDPVAVPDLDLTLGSGQLPPATTLYYRHSYIDQYGLETAAGPEVSVVTPSAIGIPGPPQIEAVTGGTLTPGLYWYGLTSHQGDSETPLSTPSVANLTDFLTVELRAPDGLPVGSDAVSIWRQGPLESGFTRIATIAVADPLDPPDPLYVDDGTVLADPCACDPENLPPDQNFTGAASSATFTVDALEIAGSTGVQRWRLYRSSVSGQYSSESLVAEIVQTVDELSGDLVAVYVDDGTVELSAGAPLGVSQTLAPSQPLDVHSGEAALDELPFADGAGEVTWRAPLVADIPSEAAALNTLPFADGAGGVAFRALTPVDRGPAVSTIAADRTCDATDDVVLVDAAAAAVTVTLPAASAGRAITVKRIDSVIANAVTVATPGAETIDGAASATLPAQYDVVRLVSDATNWFLL
jgi:hypothetical protein